MGCRYSEFGMSSTFYLITSVVSHYMDYALMDGWMDGFGKSRRILASKRTPKGRVNVILCSPKY